MYWSSSIHFCIFCKYLEHNECGEKWNIHTFVIIHHTQNTWYRNEWGHFVEITTHAHPATDLWFYKCVNCQAGQGDVLHGGCVGWLVHTGIEPLVWDWATEPLSVLRLPCWGTRAGWGRGRRGAVRPSQPLPQPRSARPSPQPNITQWQLCSFMSTPSTDMI